MIVRKKLLVSVAVMAVLSATAVVSAARVGAAGTVRGRGSVQLGPSPSQTGVPVLFECVALADLTATQTRVLPPAQGGCQLKQNNVVIASAPGISLPGSLATTAHEVSVNVAAGPLDVCWNVGATYVDGGEVLASGCDDLGVNPLPTIPTIPTTPTSITLPTTTSITLPTTTSITMPTTTTTQGLARSGTIEFTGSYTTPPTFAPSGLFGPAVNGTWTFSGAGFGHANGVPGSASVAASGRYHTGMVNVFGHGAFCGESGGSDGSGTIAVGANEVDFVDFGWVQSAAGVIVFTADAIDSTGTRIAGLVGVAIAQGGAPCFSTGATNFTVIGIAHWGL